MYHSQCHPVTQIGKCLVQGDLLLHSYTTLPDAQYDVSECMCFFNHTTSPSRLRAVFLCSFGDESLRLVTAAVIVIQVSNYMY